MAVKKKKSKAEEKVVTVTPEVVSDVPVTEEFNTGNVTDSNKEETYVVKIDNKKFDNRTLDQVQAIIFATAGTFKKVTIEQE